ncbi:MAG TPA: quinone-dependent dihydroorotate dehydrogenase [Pseudolabrys sp.]|nr:quinone-dependent dihydroorotate dehydrogenase [Pseudolabrys sp.]
MIGLFDLLTRPLLRAMGPEHAHKLAIKALRHLPLLKAPADPAELAVRAFGLNFPNPVGLAAGFDKNAEVPDALLRLGFGFVEVGTITPRAQAGNEKPRLFRLDADQAVINRLGFNNEGAAAAHIRLAARRSRGGIVGVNIGANRDSANRSDDYARLVETFAGVASYFTINVSSPNTPGLRDLQQADALNDLLTRVLDARERVRARAGLVPVLLKIAPDLKLPDLDDVVSVARRQRVDGMIVSNTTISRPRSLSEREKAREQGGLSGRPLFRLSTRMLAETFVRVEGAFPLIGVGGIDSGAAAIEKIKAGATLLQLYTGMIYRGIGLVKDIKAEIAAALRREGRNSIISIVGTDAAAITAESWPD